MTSTKEAAILIPSTLPMVSARSLLPCPAVHLLHGTPLPHELCSAHALVARAVTGGHTHTRVMARTGGHRAPGLVTKLTCQE